MPEDAAALLELRRRLDRESSFMMLEPGERAESVAETRGEIERLLGSANSTILVAAVPDGRLAGYLSAEGGPYRRNRHVAWLVIGVAREFAGTGIGRALLAALEEWAVAHALRRLELTVMTHNERAIRLYRSAGFETEGVRRRAMRVGGRDVDEYLMAKLLAEG